MSQLAKTFAYDFAALTDRGRVRPQNEDSVAAFPEFGVWAVADGMGGAAAGDLASTVAVRELDRRPGARHVGALEVCSTAPGRREGGGVDHGVHHGAVLGQDAEVADDEVGGGVAQVAERGQVAAGGHHRVAVLGQIADHVPAEEAAGSGDQDA